jgi:hypothetical protein
VRRSIWPSGSRSLKLRHSRPWRARGRSLRVPPGKGSWLRRRNSWSKTGAILKGTLGGVAQLVERYVRNVEVGGSSPLTSTRDSPAHNSPAQFARSGPSPGARRAIRHFSDGAVSTRKNETGTQCLNWTTTATQGGLETTWFQAEMECQVQRGSTLGSTCPLRSRHWQR